jgi:hypothetical protein
VWFWEFAFSILCSTFGLLFLENDEHRMLDWWIDVVGQFWREMVSLECLMWGGVGSRALEEQAQAGG